MLVFLIIFCKPTQSELQARKLVFTAVDRAISYYETNRGSYELSGRVYASGSMGVPQTLTLVSNEAGNFNCWNRE